MEQMTSSSKEERSALLLLLLFLVVGLGSMLVSRQARDRAPAGSTEASRSSAGGQGCGAGRIDLEEAIGGGDLLADAPDSGDARAPGTTEPSGHTIPSNGASSSGGSEESGEATSHRESERSARSPLPQGTEAFQLPITLMLSPGVPGRGSEGHVWVLGYEAGSPNGPRVEPAFSWTSGRLGPDWPLRVDAQVPSGLDLRLVYDPLDDLPDVTGAVRPLFSPQGALELRYQLDRVR